MGLPPKPIDAPSQDLAARFEKKVLDAFWEGKDARRALQECEIEAADPAKGGTPQVQDYVQRLKEAVYEKLSYSGGALRSVKSVDDTHPEWDNEHRLQESDTWARAESESIEKMKGAKPARSKEFMDKTKDFAPVDCGYSKQKVEATPAEQASAKNRGASHCAEMRTQIAVSTATMTSLELLAKRVELKNRLDARNDLVTKANDKFERAVTVNEEGMDAIKQLLEQEGVPTDGKENKELNALKKKKVEELRKKKLEEAHNGVKEIMTDDDIQCLSEFCASYAEIERTWTQTSVNLQGIEKDAETKKLWLEGMDQALAAWLIAHEKRTETCEAKRDQYSVDGAKKKTELLAVCEAFKKLAAEVENGHLLICMAEAYLVQRAEAKAYVQKLPEECSQHRPPAVAACVDTITAMSTWHTELEKEKDAALAARLAEASSFVQQILEMLRWRMLLGEKLVTEHQTQVKKLARELDALEARLAALRPPEGRLEPGDDGYDEYHELLAAMDDVKTKKKEHEDLISKLTDTLQVTSVELQRYADLKASMKLDVNEKKAESNSAEKVEKSFTTTPLKETPSDSSSPSDEKGIVKSKHADKKADTGLDKVWNYLYAMKDVLVQTQDKLAETQGELEETKGKLEARDKEIEDLKEMVRCGQEDDAMSTGSFELWPPAVRKK